MKHLDVAILLIYLIGIVALGCGFWRRSSNADRFMTAGRSLPGWVIGLSVFGSYISSITFLANPGKAYAENWNAAVFAFAMPLAAWISVRWFVPFYRRAGHVSAYEHLEKRFGPWARTYAVVCFLLMQLARLGTILYLLSLALSPLLGWEEQRIILLIGMVLTLYPLLGGTEAWVWAGVIQAVILLAGMAVCIIAILIGLPQGPAQAFREAGSEGKLSLGDFDLGLTASTFWVVLAYGFVTHLQNFGIDQSYVQRYITAESDRAAGWSVWIGTWLFMPVSVAFFFIGTALWAFYRGRPDFDATVKPDAVFPHFIATVLPPGLTGLVIAAICAAAMDSNLNCCSTLFLCDVYRRYIRPRAHDRESIWVLRLSTLALGAIGTMVGLALLQARKGALDVWWQLAGIFSGGLLGLFLLGILSSSVRSIHAAIGVVAGVAVILWMTFSDECPYLKSPFHPLLPIVFGTLAIMIVGFAAGQVRLWFHGKKRS